MSIFIHFILLSVLCYVYCRDFYMGMFKRNDFLVAQDRLYKERVPFQKTYAKYGRSFKCPITYFRVADRLGIGTGPKVQIIRGGLLKKYIVIRLLSPYNYPISVNIYVGCQNKMTTTMRTTTTIGKRTDPNTSGTSPSGPANDTSTVHQGNQTEATDVTGIETTTTL